MCAVGSFFYNAGVVFYHDARNKLIYWLIVYFTQPRSSILKILNRRMVQWMTHLLA